MEKQGHFIKYYKNITFVKNMQNIFTFVEKLYKMNKTKENCEEGA